MARMTTRRQRWLGCAGCGVVLAVLGALLVWISRVLGPVVVAIGVILVAALAAQTQLARRRAIAAFRAAYAGSGRDVLVVYTDSPHWKEYIETRWLPRWGDRVIAFDRSKPWSADLPEARLWRAVAGSVEHTPVVIVVPPHGEVRIVRFFLAFRDYKHGKDARLREAEARLARILGEAPL
jgi:hypothetical protein